MSEPEQSYVSKKSCGCFGIVVMEREHEAPKMVAAAMKRGETVERMTVEAVRAAPFRCDEHRKPAAHEVASAGTAQLPGFDEVAVRPTEWKYPS